jgi:hypothetical protein
MTTAPQTAPKKTATKTAYKVLKFPAKPAPIQTSGGATMATSGVPTPAGLQDVGTVEAQTANAAIRSVIDKHGAGQYVAVPARSWKPVTVTIEKTTVVKLG